MGSRKSRQRNRRRLAAASADPERRVLWDWTKVLSHGELRLIRRAAREAWLPNVTVAHAAMDGILETLRNGSASHALDAAWSAIRISIDHDRNINRAFDELAALEAAARATGPAVTYVNGWQPAHDPEFEAWKAARSASQTAPEY